MTSDDVRRVILARCCEIGEGEFEAFMEPDRIADAMADVMSRVLDAIDEFEERLDSVEEAARLR
jgi:hypothetical protein